MEYELTQPSSEAEFQQYYEFRWRLLRQPWGQPRGSERDELEAAEATRHVAALQLGGGCIGVGRVHLNSAQEAQIRYLAVKQECRKLGIGQAIVEKLEAYANSQAAHRIVLNAREEILGFYERLGYRVIAAGPTMFGSIKHSRMEKRLE